MTRKDNYVCKTIIFITFKNFILFSLCSLSLLTVLLIARLLHDTLCGIVGVPVSEGLQTFQWLQALTICTIGLFFFVFITVTIDDIRSKEAFYSRVLLEGTVEKEKVSWYLRWSAAIILFLLSISKAIEARASYVFKTKESVQHSAPADVNKPGVTIKIDGRQELIKDPFGISLELADKINDEDMIKLYDLLKKQKRELIDQKFKEYKATALALSGDEVIPFNRIPSLEDTEQVKRRTGKICYVISRPKIQQLSSWSVTKQTTPWNDHYPTLELYIGRPDWEDEKVFRKGFRKEADLDTGNGVQGVSAFDHEVWVDLEYPNASGLQDCDVWGGFKYRASDVKLGVKDCNGNKKVLPIEVMFVKDWQQSPFKAVFNAGCNGFVGRELMFKFGLKVELDAPNKKTSVLSLG